MRSVLCMKEKENFTCNHVVAQKIVLVISIIGAYEDMVIYISRSCRNLKAKVRHAFSGEENSPAGYESYDILVRERVGP